MNNTYTIPSSDNHARQTARFPVTEDRKAVVESLSALLASTHILYQKTLFYHWNVTGESFFSLHAAFETQYKDLQDAGDMVAERIRALGSPAPGTLAEFRSFFSVDTAHIAPRTARDMVEMLLQDHMVCCAAARAVHILAEDNKDHATMDLMVKRMFAHDKVAWMLRAFLS